MSVMEKIFGAFKAGTPPQNTGVPANTINTPPNNVPANTPGTAPNGVVPQDGAKPPEDKSPVDKFADLWQPTPIDKTKPIENESVPIDQAKLMEAAGKVDFARVITQEELQKISAGGDGAVAALVSALNKTAQTVFGQSTIVAEKIIAQRIEESNARLTAQIPDMVRKQSFQNGLLETNPAFSNPAVLPVITALQMQLSEKYPKATQSELRTMAQEYLTGVAEMVTPKQKETPSSKSGKGNEEDWEAYLST